MAGSLGPAPSIRSRLVFRPVAEWNERFDLVLLLLDGDWRAESSPPKEICAAIDKRKLESAPRS